MELYVKSREEWRRWLETNHASIENVWLIYYKKLSGKPRISYEDAVEEALCFGWIDGKIKRIDEECYEQLFTPRRRGSRWSKLNMERVRKLTEANLMTPSGIKAFREAIDRPELTYDNKIDAVLEIPADLMDALSKSSIALNNFNNLPPSSRRLYLLWLNNAKRTQTRQVRIARIVGFAENNIRAGMM